MKMVRHGLTQKKGEPYESEGAASSPSIVALSGTLIPRKTTRDGVVSNEGL